MRLLLSKNRTTRWGLLLLLIAMLGGSARLFAQAVANAQISGVVADPSGAVVPGAKVTATQTDMGLVRTTLSSSSGTYALPNLPIGPYRLEVAASGFTTYVRTGIVLQVSNNVEINVTLQVGAVTQEVKVSADASMVQTQSTSVAQVIDPTRIIDLPLNGRLATQLVLLSGASYNTQSGALVSSKNYQTSATISVAGGQVDGTNYMMDGGDNNNAFTNVNLPFPFPDAIQEFSVQTSGLSARYGLHPGGVINVVTKAGGNQIHGDLFEFVRNGDFNARDFFAKTQDTLRRNQFGGTVGGPLRKDKLFGFFGYQGWRQRTAPATTTSYVPTQAMLNGDWSAFDGASCQSSHVARTITDPITGGPAFTGYQIPTSLFNAQALALLKYVPVSTDPCGKLVYAIPSPVNEDQYIGRADWNVSAKHQLFGRYYITDYSNPPEFGGDVLLSTRAGVYDRSQSVVLGDTYTISPRMLNSLHLIWDRLRINRGTTSDMIGPSTLGIKTFQLVPNDITLTVNGGFSAGCGTCASAIFHNNTYQLADDLDFMRGRHHLSFGVDWVHNQLNEVNISNGNGNFTFSGQASGDPMLDFMLGLPSAFTQGMPEDFNPRQNYLGAYADDNIKLSSRLSINAGLRWEPFFPETDVFGRGNYYSYSNFVAGVHTNRYVNAPNGLLYTSDAGIPTGYAYSKLATFEPRIGLVWDPSGNGRQELRAGVGLFSDLPLLFYGVRFADGPPWASTVSLTSPSGGLTNPWANYPGGDPFPVPFPPSSTQAFPSGGVYVNMPLNLHPTHMAQWNLTYQRQLGKNWMLSATYLGDKSTHVWTTGEQDPAVYIPGEQVAKNACSVDKSTGQYPLSCTGNTAQRRVLYLQNATQGALYSTIDILDDGANAEYNALLLVAQHRFNEHYTVLANYTYSHCISEGDNQGGMGSPAYQNPYNRDGDRGNCNFDIRHNVNVSLVANSPHFANRFTNGLLGNWQFSPILMYHTGVWFSPVTGVDNSLTGVGNDRPNVVSSTPYLRQTSNASPLRWITASAYANNTTGTFGNAGRDSLVGPRYFDVDAALTRSFRIREHQQLSLRFEFFNLFNNVNFSNPDNSVKDSTFGEILSDNGAPRILQFALKYEF
jgi:hypothetical protein